MQENVSRCDTLADIVEGRRLSQYDPRFLHAIQPILALGGRDRRAPARRPKPADRFDPDDGWHQRIEMMMQGLKGLS
jgi:hypothetical protein